MFSPLISVYDIVYNVSRGFWHEFCAIWKTRLRSRQHLAYLGYNDTKALYGGLIMNATDLFTPVGIALALVTVVWIMGSIWYLSACTSYVGLLCEACMEEIRQERETPPIVVQASPDMTAEQLAALLREAEAAIQAEQAAPVQG